MRAPDFWQSRGPVAKLLAPVGMIYALATALRLKTARPFDPGVPVISVGNLSVGGTGKTPLVRWLVDYLAATGRNPHVILRGHGGCLRGPVRVDTQHHQFTDVGDEALLHARHGPTWVARDRAAGAREAVSAGADMLVLDDAHQNPGLIKTLSVVVIDGQVGLMNAYPVPAGPLRELPGLGLARADVVIFMGGDRTALTPRLPNSLPVISARLNADPAAAARLRGQPVVGFAGIGRPGKFLGTLQVIGAHVRAFHAFGDHQPYEEADISPILEEAFGLRALPVTTEKDAVRLPPDQRQQVDVLPVSVNFDRADADRFKAMLAEL